MAEAVQGKRLVYLFRRLKDAATKNAMAMAFTTDNERSKTKDFDSTPTKDGNVGTPGGIEQEITAEAILAKGDTMADDMEEAMDNDEIIEIWEINLDEPGTSDGKFKAKYFQGYLTEFSLASSAEDHVTYSTAFGINGKGVAGEATVTQEQQDVAAYVFTDTQKTGA